MPPMPGAVRTGRGATIRWSGVGIDGVATRLGSVLIAPVRASVRTGAMPKPCPPSRGRVTVTGDIPSKEGVTKEPTETGRASAKSRYAVPPA